MRTKHMCLLLMVLLLASCGADQNLKRGEKYLALGEYYDAANEFKKAYQKTPSKDREKRGRISKRQALCWERINQTPKAIASYRNVIRYKQDDVMTHLSFARQLLRNANYKEAATEFEQVLDSLPDNELALQFSYNGDKDVTVQILQEVQILPIMMLKI